MKHQSLKVISICAAALIMTGMAQPDNGRAPEPDEQRAPHREQGPNKKVLEIRINADALRARLNRSILRAQQTLESHQSALTKLDEGASPTEVLATLRLEGIARNSSNEHRGNQQRRPADDSRPPQPEFSPEEREEMHGFLRENFPDLWSNLQQFAELDPRNADRLLAQMSPQIREILYLEESEPDLAKLKIQEMRVGLAFVEASRKYRLEINNPSASESERAETAAQLRQAAADRFDIQLKAKQFEILKLESRLNELKSSVNEIEQRRENEIDRMIKSASRPLRPRGAQRRGNQQEDTSGDN